MKYVLRADIEFEAASDADAALKLRLHFASIAAEIQLGEKKVDTSWYTGSLALAPEYPPAPKATESKKR